jgi:hypothetical protein
MSPCKEMTKFCVGVALNGNSAKCPMTIVALLGKLILKNKIKNKNYYLKKKPHSINQFH